MKIKNFKLIGTKGETLSNRIYEASVDVETGFLFWKKVKTEIIQKEFAGYWFFQSTGKFTPDLQVETLARAWKAKTGEDC